MRANDSRRRPARNIGVFGPTYSSEPERRRRLGDSLQVSDHHGCETTPAATADHRVDNTTSWQLFTKTAPRAPVPARRAPARAASISDDAAPTAVPAGCSVYALMVGRCCGFGDQSAPERPSVTVLAHRLSRGSWRPLPSCDSKS